MATSSLSLLPAGLGMVDAALVLALVAGGVPAASALPTVLLYRLVSVVGVVAAGWAVRGAHRLRSGSAGVVAWSTTRRPVHSVSYS